MTSSARDLLLLAAGQLLHEACGGNVSTRAICERAGVQAPTLYHHFGSKQGLLDAVVNFGFKCATGWSIPASTCCCTARSRRPCRAR